MACVELPPPHVDSEMEEGEIIDEADVLSDISSEEEFLLRQRLEVLENYNNVLERKEARKTSFGSGTGKEHPRRQIICDLSKVSGTENGGYKQQFTFKIINDKKPPRSKQKKAKILDKASSRHKEHRKKNQHKRKAGLSDSDSSELSDYDYMNKRRKLADAVSLNQVKNDKSTLKDRLSKMLNANKLYSQGNKKDENQTEKEKPISTTVPDNNNTEETTIIHAPNLANGLEISPKAEISQAIPDSLDLKNGTVPDNSEGTSDEDLEALRQHALKTKSVKSKDEAQQKMENESKTENISEDEDSDTAELRMICLKSAVLKKAIEMKRKQKLHKRLTQSSNIHEFDMNGVNIDNNTDIESVDMELGSDADDKGKVYITECSEFDDKTNHVPDNVSKEDELEEDEDLLRARLLTSLSKNLPNLVDFNVLDTNELKLTEVEKVENVTGMKVNNVEVSIRKPVVEAKKFIIELGGSDSEGEDETTKNLTRMHLKLSEQSEFQQKLDMFLKSTRLEVEKTKSPNVALEQPKPAEKFVAKAMNHLPKSEQIEYKNLVKRMAELEKIKQARQNLLMNNNIYKDTLKPRNTTLESYKIATTKKLEERIALSRKKIAEESAKMLRLKEEATKLSQKYKIVATELRNIATAITLNKREQKTVQNGLCKIRHQHQILLKSAPIKHSNQHFHITPTLDKLSINRVQKENDPLKEDHKIPNKVRPLKVNVNDLNEKNSVDNFFTNNKKVMTLPKSPLKDRIVDLIEKSIKKVSKEKDSKEKIDEQVKDVNSKWSLSNMNDYRSPLDSLQCKTWQEDPNGVLCPFEFDGSCRDPECKYIHPKVPNQ